MYITCKCLNVSVKTRSDELMELDRDTINDLSNKNCDCDFFQLPLATANELEEINKKQCSLVVNENINKWCTHRCINCSMYTHAVHRYYSAGFVLINKNMITSKDEIEKLKSHPHYSSVFKILIDYNQLNSDDEQQQKISTPLTKYSVSQLSNNIQLSLTNLQQQLEQAIQNEAGIIDEKIQTFTVEQYQLLEQFRERAHIEYNLLCRIICDNNNHSNHQESLNTMKISDLKDKSIGDMKLMKKTYCHDASVNGINFIFVESSDDNKSKLNVDSCGKGNESRIRNNTTPNIGSKLKQKRGDFVIEKNNEYDGGEAMFPLEGMDDTIHLEDQEIISEMEGSDAEDSGQDEGIHIPRERREGYPILAKSLPVSVPNFSTFHRRAMQESDDDQLSMDPLDPHNIRASIKALAKSVHGDAVFGDLPRPRFSTQI